LPRLALDQAASRQHGVSVQTFQLSSFRSIGHGISGEVVGHTFSLDKTQMHKQHQSDHKARVWIPDPKLATIAIQWGELADERVPIDLAGELHRLAFEVDDLVNTYPEQTTPSCRHIFFGRIVPSP
jgi:hypothetical protein